MEKYDSPFLYKAVYLTLHIPTGKMIETTALFQSRCKALELMSGWTRQQPGVWAYWLKDGQVYDDGNPIYHKVINSKMLER